MLFIQKDMNAALRNSARGDANRFFAGAFAMSTGAMRESHNDVRRSDSDDVPRRSVSGGREGRDDGAGDASGVERVEPGCAARAHSATTRENADDEMNVYVGFATRAFLVVDLWLCQ